MTQFERKITFPGRGWSKEDKLLEGGGCGVGLVAFKLPDFVDTLSSYYHYDPVVL